MVYWDSLVKMVSYQVYREYILFRDVEHCGTCSVSGISSIRFRNSGNWVPTDLNGIPGILPNSGIGRNSVKFLPIPEFRELDGTGSGGGTDSGMFNIAEYDDCSAYTHNLRDIKGSASSCAYPGSSMFGICSTAGIILAYPSSALK
jgi:hypothetical protein